MRWFSADFQCKISCPLSSDSISEFPNEFKVDGPDGHFDPNNPHSSATDSDIHTFPQTLSPEVLQALRSVRFIAQHIKDADKDNEVGYLAVICFRCELKHSNTRISDRSRLEVRVDGFGSILFVGVHIELHRRHIGHHLSESVIV